MTSHKTSFRVRLFYSYCHKDMQHKDAMEKSLALLKREKLLNTWSDRNILSGQQISKTVKTAMDKADIIVFLISQNFIASDECMKEWDYAKQLTTNGKLSFRVPIILEDCSWKDLLANDNIKALPRDGKAVTKFKDSRAAWHDVYLGIKDVIEELKNTFTPKTEFLKEMEETEFLSQTNIKLRDIFSFLPLLCDTTQKKDELIQGEYIVNESQLLERGHVLIHGEEMSGKTALIKYLFLYLSDNSNPVLRIDLKKTSGQPKEKIFSEAYSNQFNGDYSLWKQQTNKTLVLDNLSSTSNLEFVVFAKSLFDRIIVTLSSDTFNAFFKDEERLADFCITEIQPLGHRQQEHLIRERLKLSEQNETITDGRIDQVENHVNSVIIANKIVPRYPFYVLSILQTYEGYMPSNLSITSYGHCYSVLIIANLIKAGVSQGDDDINACFHFAAHLAFQIYKNSQKSTEITHNFYKFLSRYREEFIVPEAILNRLQHPDFGIITKDGFFKAKYMYYFFLGKFLSQDRAEHQVEIERMCTESHVTQNYLTLIFVIHHANDDKIIDDILLGSLCTLDTIHPAALTQDETTKFNTILTNSSKNILSSNSVDEERGKERDARDIAEHQDDPEDISEQMEDGNPANDVYKILKNNQILSQVIRNRYGSMEKSKIEEIIETISDSGLRLVNLILKDENEIAEYAHYIQKKKPEIDLQRVDSELRLFSFLWTMLNIEKIVSAINHPSIRDVVAEVVKRKSTPAYDLIKYFSRLEGEKELTEHIQQDLKSLLKKHDDKFLKKVLSIRTQHYMNTHRSDTNIEQTVCSLLKIKYSQRKSYHN